MRRIALGACLACSFASFPAAAQTTGSLDWQSEVGDFVGDGGSDSYTEADGSFGIGTNFDNGVSLTFDLDGGGVSWNLDFAAPGDAPLTSSTLYENAQRFPFQASDRPGLSMTAFGRGCNTLTGEFTVNEVVEDWFGAPVRFDAEAEQHCEDAEPALFAQIDVSVGTLGPATLTPGNLLCTVEERLLELTPGGELVQEIPLLGGDGSPPISEYLRDVVRDTSGRIHLFNGTFSPVVSTFTPATGEWEHHELTGWSTVNNVSYGGIATFDGDVFVTDMATANPGEPQGIVRFEPDDGWSAERFAESREYIDLAMGLDGWLYALRDDETTVDVFNPRTLAERTGLTLAQGVRGIAVAPNGTVFGASWDGMIYRFDSAGVVQNSLDPGLSNLVDIDLVPGGTIYVGGRFGEVVVTTGSLASFTDFDASAGLEAAFVASAAPSVDLTRLFADDFESEDTSGWDEVVGVR